MNAIFYLNIETTEPANGPGHEDPPDPGTCPEGQGQGGSGGN